MVEKPIQRKLTTILAADVEGYSRLMRADEEATLRTLAEYREIIDGLIERHNGRIFSTGGDSVLAEFGSAVEAVRCAITIQDELRVRNAEYPADRQMRFRIGINIGDVMVRDSELFGDGVNVAARLEGLAEAGGVCISGSVFEQVKYKLSLGFQDIGAQEVKNISEPIPAFRVVPGPVTVNTHEGTSAAAKRWRIAAIAAAVAVILPAAAIAWWQLRDRETGPASAAANVRGPAGKPVATAAGHETLAEFVAREEKRVQEASGGAALNGHVYLVDDEKPYVYEYQYAPQHNKAVFLERYRITDGRKAPRGIKRKHVDKVHDLEGAAAYDGHLYVVTSHSLTKKGQTKEKRELLLRIEKFEKPADGEPVARVGDATSLTAAIRKSFAALKERNANLRETSQRWNVEGFAIDPSGTAYFGFRNPLLELDNQIYAIVLTGKINELFSGEAQLKPILLHLENSGRSYGIGALEIDNQALFIVGKSPRSESVFEPSLWTLKPTDARIQEPVLVRDWSLMLPPGFQAVPEVLVLPPNSQHGFVFLDAPGHGGQRVYRRTASGAISSR